MYLVRFTVERGLVLASGTDGCQVSKRRENDADLADSEMLRALSRDSAAKRRRLEKAGEGLRVLMALIERRRDSGLEVSGGLTGWARGEGLLLLESVYSFAESGRRGCVICTGMVSVVVVLHVV